MSKITRALEKASEERSQVISPVAESETNLVNSTRGTKMRKSWFTWTFVIVSVAAVFIWFNYQGGRDAVPLSEIFPDEEVFPVDVEYEFVEDESVSSGVEKIAAVKEKVEEKIENKVIASKISKPKTLSLAPPTQAIGAKTNYTVQIASFKSEKKALEALTKIREKVPTAYISSSDLGAKGIWYRVYAGQYQLRSDAEVSLGEIKQSFGTSFIISPKRSK